MKALRLWLVVGLNLAVVCSPNAGILMGPVTNAANSHIYYLLTPNTWTASQAEALSLGGNLVTINDASEQDWVFQTFSANSGTSRGLWIGLNDLRVDGYYEWVSGDFATYRYWGPLQPDKNQVTEHFAHMWPVGGPDAIPPGTWNDLFDTASYGFTLNGVVEKEPRLATRITIASVEISWQSESNKSYQVQFASEVTQNLWTNIGQPVAGSGLRMSIVDSVAQNLRRFYRVLEVQ